MNKISMLNANQKQFVKNVRISFNDNDLVDEYHNNFHNWDRVGEFYSDLSGIEACEYAYDLSNNPRMHNERKLVQGLSRTFSIGDVVEVVEIAKDGFEEYRYYICLDMGWREVNG